MKIAYYTFRLLANQATDIAKETGEKSIENLNADQEEMEKLAEENEGLRKGLQEILDFLKDNSE